MAVKKTNLLAHGHRSRLRERFMDAPEKLPEYELLELLLGYVLTRKDTKPLAKQLIARFGSLRGVFDARVEELRMVEGVGPGVETFSRLLREVMARHVETPIRNRQKLCSPEAVAAMARKRLGQASAEEVWVAYVDTSNRLISWEKLSQGTIDSSFMPPRDILERALLRRAKGFILVHNHPGGSLRPSGADITITQKIQQGAQLLNIIFLDHLIVTESACYSMMNEGLL